MGIKRRDVRQPRYNNGPTAEQLRAGFSAQDLHCTPLASMTEKEIRAIEREYGAKVVRPIPGRKTRAKQTKHSARTD